MDFGSKSIGVSVIIAGIIALVAYVKSLVEKKNSSSSKAASLENELGMKKDEEKIEKEVNGEELVELVDRANDRLRKRRKG